MTERSKSKSRLFFIEILIIIVFFSICAGVCMNLFAKAKLISVESSDLTKGVMVAQAAAEAVKAEGDSPELERLLGGCRDGNIIRIYYDGQWQKLPRKEAAVYELAVRLTEEQGVLAAEIRVQKGDQEIHTQKAKAVQPYRLWSGGEYYERKTDRVRYRRRRNFHTGDFCGAVPGHPGGPVSGFRQSGPESRGEKRSGLRGILSGGCQGGGNSA